MTSLSCSSILGLIAAAVGVIAAMLMFFYPPIVQIYTNEGAAIVAVVNQATPEGAKRGRRQSFMRMLGPWLLAGSFALQAASIIVAQP